MLNVNKATKSQRALWAGDIFLPEPLELADSRGTGCSGCSGCSPLAEGFDPLGTSTEVPSGKYKVQKNVNFHLIQSNKPRNTLLLILTVPLTGRCPFAIQAFLLNLGFGCRTHTSIDLQAWLLGFHLFRWFLQKLFFLQNSDLSPNTKGPAQHHQSASHHQTAQHCH